VLTTVILARAGQVEISKARKIETIKSEVTILAGESCEPNLVGLPLRRVKSLQSGLISPWESHLDQNQESYDVESAIDAARD